MLIHISDAPTSTEASSDLVQGNLNTPSYEQTSSTSGQDDAEAQDEGNKSLGSDDMDIDSDSG